MIVEQIRYYLAEENLEDFLAARRELSSLRARLDLPEGRSLIADPVPDEGPAVVWQCGYDDEGQMGLAEARLMGSEEYASARERINALVERVVLELYSADGD
ncbi:MAG TPA: hypothetical protein VFB58_01830 [Chloroflexota bacterium]|nr:hypothetical protein [Chloroflexota bacterium]